MNASYISVSDVQNIYCTDLDLTGYSNATISGMISAASRNVDSFTVATQGWDLETIVNEEHDSMVNVHTDPDGNLHIPLIKRPLVSLASVSKITIALAPYTTDLVLTNTSSNVVQYLYHSPYPGWELIYPNSALITVGTLLGAVRLGSLRSYRFMCDVSYQGGYATIPDDIKYATSLYFRTIFSKRYNPTGAFEVSQGSMSQAFFARGQTKFYSPFQQEAQDVLSAYVRVV